MQVYAFQFYDITNLTAPCAGAIYGSRRQVNNATRFNTYDTNDAQSIAMNAIVSNTNTSARTYTIFGSHENPGTGTFYFNYSSEDSSTYGWTTPFVFTKTEIAQ